MSVSSPGAPSRAGCVTPVLVGSPWSPWDRSRREMPTYGHPADVACGPTCTQHYGPAARAGLTALRWYRCRTQRCAPPVPPSHGWLELLPLPQLDAKRYISKAVPLRYHCSGGVPPAQTASHPETISMQDTHMTSALPILESIRGGRNGMLYGMEG